MKHAWLIIPMLQLIPANGLHGQITPSKHIEAREIITRLASVEFAVREQATRQLQELGVDAVDSVFETVTSPHVDAECRARCLGIIRVWLDDANAEIISQLEFHYEHWAEDGDRNLVPERMRVALEEACSVDEATAIRRIERCIEASAKNVNGVWIITLGDKFVNPDRVLRFVAAIRSPIDLRIHHKTRFSTADYRQIARAGTIRSLQLPNGLDDKQLTLIVKMKGLRRLVLPEQSQVTDQGITALSELESLEFLKIYTRRLGQPAFRTIGNLKNLREIDFGWAYNTDTESAKHLAKLTDLTTLNLRGTYLTDEQVFPFQGLPNVVRFIGNQVYMGDQAISTIVSMPRVETVVLSNSRVTDAGIHQLAAIAPQLKVLHVNDTTISDASLDDLSRFTNLTLLKIDDTMISPGGATRLASRLPNTKIVADQLQEFPPDIVENCQQLCRLGAVVDPSYNGSYAVTLNRTWTGQNKDLLLINQLPGLMHFGINIPVDDAMAEVVLQVQPTSIMIDAKHASDKQLKRWRKHHRHIHVIR